jgi:hypothetical protein
MKRETLARSLGQKHIESRRRTHRLAPGVMGLSLVMIFTAFVFVVVPPPALASGPVSSSPDCIPCPGGGRCWPNCGPPPPPPSCPTPYALYIGSGMLATNPTNASIQYWLLDTSGETAASSSLTWGPNASYQYTAISNQGVGTSGSVTAFIDFLDPSTTYYYHVHAWTSCTDGSGTHQYIGDYYGSFTTGLEATYVGQYGAVIRGVVYNANGGTAPAGLEVYVQCTGYSLWSQYAYTNAQGAYSISPALGATGCTTNGYGYYIVEVLNSVISNPGNPSVQWPGYWNESIVIWAVQFVNFYLPLNIIGPWIPQVVDYSNAPSGYSTISFSTSTKFTNSVVDNFAASGGAYVGPIGGGVSFQTSTTTSQSVTTKSSYTSFQGSLEVLDRFWTSGMVEFNAIDRSLNAPVETPYGSEVYEEQGPSYITPTNTGMYVIPGYSAIKLSPQQQQQYQVTVTGSTTVSYNYSMNFGITVELDAVSFTVGLTMGWGASTTTTYVNDLSGVVGGPTTTTTECFTIYGSGGSQSSGTATMIDILMYSPNWPSGSC